mmetsp:Transcript_71064/g.156816  ORF Transcript_71064/g.156816 Transcript_71064/m.156816 type:complete len:1013 (-) Transcript_71064:34-3072(-)
MTDLPGDGKEGGFGANATGIESIDAALQLFDMCRPAESGATIALEQLAQVLKQHVGETHDVDKVLRPLRSETGQTSMGDGRVDFLSYWQCMDSFFREISGGPERLSEAALSQETDTIRGMRRFRDGVLELWRKGNPTDVIPSLALKTLLSEIRDASDDPSYWEEVMQAVPCDGNLGLSLAEVAEAVCVWLRDVVREEEEDDDSEDEDDDDMPEAASPPSKITSFEGKSGEASKDRGDNSPRFSLKSELRQADSAYSTVTPPVSPQVPFGRSSTFAIGDRSAARHRDSLGVGPASEILRAQELVELIRRAVDESGDVPSQRAMQKLNLAHDAIARQLHQQDLELIDLRRSHETAEKRLKRMEEDLSQAQESQHEEGEKSRQLEDYIRKASALELELEELRNHLVDAQQEIQQLRDKVEEADQKVAEVKKRDWQLRDRIESLEEHEANTEGQLKWMRSELDNRTSELDVATQQLTTVKAENVTLNSNMAKVEQELKASKEAQLKSHAEAGKRASVSAEQAALAATLQKELAQVKEELQASKTMESQLRSQVETMATKEPSEEAKKEAKDPELEKLKALEIDFRAQLQMLQQELDSSKSSEEALRTKLGSSEEEAKKSADLEQELAKLKEELASEKSARASEIRQRDAEASEAAGSKIVALENKVQLQQDQLKQLRAARDNILASQQDLPGTALEDEDLSPRQMMSDRQCRYLLAQLRILLRHSQELEQLLDTSEGISSEARRKQSLQRVHEEGKRVFDELSEKLYTLEVQKNDVDEEVGRLQTLVADLENQLASVRRQRDELQRSSASASTGRPESGGLELGVAVGRSSKAFTASVTSDTRSRASLDSPGQKPGTARTSSSDAAAFFTGSRSTSELRSSPKANLMQGVVKVLSPSAFVISDTDSKLVKQQEKRKNLRQGQRHVRDTYGNGNQLSVVPAAPVRASLHKREPADEEQASDNAWKRRPSQAVRKSRSVDPRAENRFSAAKLATKERRESLQQRMREMKQPDPECGTQ